MSIEQLTTFFAWNTVINFALLTFSTVVIVAARGWVSGIHAKLFGMAEGEINRLYFGILGFYKILIIVFGLVPYLVLRLVM